MQDRDFEWDDDKTLSNLAKHQIDFEMARLVFADPGFVDDVDDTMDYGEQRYRAVGMANGRVVTVFYTQRGARIRINSARKPSRKEQATYARQNPPD